MAVDERPTGESGDGWARHFEPKSSPADRDALHRDLGEQNRRRLGVVAFLLVPAMGVFIFLDQPTPQG